jgi:hypothetical protein
MWQNNSVGVLEKIGEEAVVAYLMVQSRHSPGGTEENHMNRPHAEYKLPVHDAAPALMPLGGGRVLRDGARETAASLGRQAFLRGGLVQGERLATHLATPASSVSPHGRRRHDTHPRIRTHKSTATLSH